MIAPLEHVGKAAVEQFVYTFGVDVALIVDAKHVLRKVLRCLAPDLLATRFAVEPRIMARTVHRSVTRAVMEREALVRTDRREADDITFGSYPPLALACRASRAHQERLRRDRRRSVAR